MRKIKDTWVIIENIGIFLILPHIEGIQMKLFPPTIAINLKKQKQCLHVILGVQKWICKESFFILVLNLQL